MISVMNEIISDTIRHAYTAYPENDRLRADLYREVGEFLLDLAVDLEKHDPNWQEMEVINDESCK